MRAVVWILKIGPSVVDCDIATLRICRKSGGGMLSGGDILMELVCTDFANRLIQFVFAWPTSTSVDEEIYFPFMRIC